MTKRDVSILIGLGILAVLILIRSQVTAQRYTRTTPALPARTSTAETHRVIPATPHNLPRVQTVDEPTVNQVTPSPTNAKTMSDRDTLTGERVLSFYSAADMKQFVDNAHAMGLEVLDHMEFGNSVRIRVTDPSLLDAVLYVSPAPIRSSSNFRVTTPPSSTPIATFGETPHQGFGADVLTWLGVPVDHQSWGKGVTIAILDTPATAEHGRAVTSLITGQDNSLAGLAPAATILSVPVLSAEGRGDTYTLAKAIVDAVQQGVDVINMSVGSYGDSAILRDAVAYAIAQGVVVVAAAGNDSLSEICYPARYEGVIAVGAIDASGQHMDFSNSGAEMDLAAPGLAILVASTNEAGVGVMSGTSISTPLVSGAIAALASVGGITVTNAAALLVSYADDQGLADHDAAYGSGIMNIPRVLVRDQSGIYDVGVGQPWITVDGQGYSLHVYVENRGTETLGHVAVSINVGGVPMTANFYSLAPMSTAQQTLTLALPSADATEAIEISLLASITGHEDAHAADNSCRGSITRP